MSSIQSDAVRAFIALVVLALVTAGLGFGLRGPNTATVSITYLLVVLIVAATSRLRVAVVTSIAAMLCLNFFFLPPVGTLAIADPHNWVALLAFLAVSLVGSRLSATARARTAIAIERAQLLEERKAAELTRQHEQLKTTLLASLSHDLRTPLTAIQVAASNIKTPGLTADERNDQSDIILSETERLARLFENLLEMTRIDAGGVTSEARLTHPSEIVAAAQDQVEQTLHGHPVDLDIDADVPVRLDPRLTATALAHVLENAAQYSAPRTSITITARTDAQGLVLQVRDRGPGIPPSEMPHLFERFYRGVAASTRRSGTGMGLWIARGLLAVEGGRVWAENCSDGGAQFTIAVPAAVQVPASATPRS